MLPAINPLRERGVESIWGSTVPTNTGPTGPAEEGDPPNPSRIPKLRKPIKKNKKKITSGESIRKTLQCSVDSKGDLQCEDPAKVSKWKYRGKPVNRITFGEIKENKDKSPDAPEIPDNPFKKASDENWIQTHVLNNPDYQIIKKNLINIQNF
jgi:hypothetical protein